jgi:putative transposase
LQFTASERRVCGLMSIEVSSYSYRSRRSDELLREKLVRLAGEKPRYGYRRLQVLVEGGGERVNHKRLWRVYREAGLCLKRKKWKHCIRIGWPRQLLTDANQEWALDFAHDVIAAGRSIRVLSVVDVYTRECLALEVDTGFASRRVTRVLDEIITSRGRPRAIRCDNGPELTSRQFLAWALEWKIELRHIQPGKPTQNAHVDSFHGRLREECLRVNWFANLFDARRKVSKWKLEYNEQRPHTQQSRLQNAGRVCASDHNKELWRRLGLRPLGKRLRRFPLCHSSGDGLDLQNHLYGFWGQVNSYSRQSVGTGLEALC